MDLRQREIHDGETNKGPSLEVRSWEIVVNPWDVAQQAAKQQEGVSCSKYLKARGDIFLNLQHPTRMINKDKGTSLTSGGESSRGDCHGDIHNKSLRARVFAS